MRLANREATVSMILTSTFKGQTRNKGRLRHAEQAPKWNDRVLSRIERPRYSATFWVACRCGYESLPMTGICVSKMIATPCRSRMHVAARYQCHPSLRVRQTTTTAERLLRPRPETVFDRSTTVARSGLSLPRAGERLIGQVCIALYDRFTV